MITIPPQTNLRTATKDLINFFNNLEGNLRYPLCEGYADQSRVLEQAEKELIKMGKV